MSVKVSVITALVFVLCLCQVYALKCYQCGSWDNPDCVDNVGSMNTEDCSNFIIKYGLNESDVSCVTLEKQDTDMNRVVIRKCHTLYGSHDACKQHDARKECHSCQTDGCNRNPILSPDALKDTTITFSFSLPPNGYFYKYNKNTSSSPSQGDIFFYASQRPGDLFLRRLAGQ